MNPRIAFSVLIGMSTILSTGCATSVASDQIQAQPAQEIMRDTISSDHNFAKTLLFRWWGIFEAPDDVDVAPFFKDLFADDAYLKMPGVELKSATQIREAFQQLPADRGRSHQLETVNVTEIANDSFQLDAKFTYQIARPDGKIDAGHSSYRHIIRKLQDGSFRLASLTAKLGDPIVVETFQPSYATNRARGTLAQYLAVTDLLESNYSELKKIMTNQTEIVGMFDPTKERHNDRGDGILRGTEEIAKWLSTRKNSFRAVAHTITKFTTTATSLNTYRADATIDVQATPKNGDPISVTLPITVHFSDNNERFMTIVRIER